MSLAERLSREERPDRSVEVRERVQERLVEVLGARLYDDAMSDVDLRRLVDTRLRELLGEEQVPLSSRRRPTSSSRSETTSWAWVLSNRSSATPRSPRSW